MERFIKLYEKAKRDFKKTSNSEELLASIKNIASLYGDCIGIGDLILTYGEELISEGNYDVGIAVILSTEKSFKIIANQTLLCIRLAEFEFKKGNVEQGKEYILRLATNTDNYEEAIEINGLTDIWNRYKSTVDILPKSKRIADDFTSNECAREISEILILPRDEMLAEISQHLDERSEGGEQMDSLTEEEKTFFYIDEFIVNVNSEGILHYLYYCGHHFPMLSLSASVIGSENLANLLLKIESKFPRKSIPKKRDTIEKYIEKMERDGVDFEEIEVLYYEEVESYLLNELSSYIRNNAKRFK